MAVTVVIEEASFASGAKLAGLIAHSLELIEPVRLLLRDPGPLESWLTEHIHGPVEICNTGNFPYEGGFAQRCSAARALLQSDASDAVYIYGMGASDFAVAARSQGRHVILHAYQTGAQIECLLARDQAKTDCAAFCDALVTAETHSRDAMSRLFGRTPACVVSVGIRVDVDWVRQAFSVPPPEVYNSVGAKLDWNNGFVVGGAGSAERGAAFMISLAQECPDIPFVWIGAERSPHADNRPGAGVLDRGLFNLYAMTDGDNEFPSLAGLGACVVCDGETGMTLPLAAAAMGIPVVGFSKAGMTELLGRYGILCHGDLDPFLARDVLGKLAAEPPSPVIQDTGERQRQLDVGGAVDSVLQVLADVRLMESDETGTEAPGS
jgi:hypothetical protein